MKPTTDRMLNRIKDVYMFILDKGTVSTQDLVEEFSITPRTVQRDLNVLAFNDLVMRRNFNSWKRAMQIKYNITRLEEWCKAHDVSEATNQLEHLMQATKLLQLKKATLEDIKIIYDVCWFLAPTQVQKLIHNYCVADYEVCLFDLYG